MPKRRFYYISILALLAGLLIASPFILRRLTHPPPLPPLEISLWYWHEPFQLSTAEIAQLKRLGVSQLFVLTGTLRDTDNGVRVIMPQQWGRNAGALPVTLVFRCDNDVVRSFERKSNDPFAASIESAATSERQRAERAGAHVVGVQLDFDCPTRLLPKYAELLRALRSKLQSQHLSLSITALPTWFTSSVIRDVMASVDFTTPQYYEADVPKTLTQFATVSRLGMVRRGLESAGRTGLPFYAGIPAFGHALVYDGSGRLRGTYRDMGASAVASGPDFRLATAYPSDGDGHPATRTAYIGEDIFDFMGATDKSARGAHLVFDLPTPELVAQHLAVIRANRPTNCRGVILFRYPEIGESLTVPLPALAAAIKGEPLQPRLAVHVKSSVAPWELIETGRAARRPPLDVTINITNDGTANTFLGPDSVTVTLHIDRPGFGDIQARGGATLETSLDIDETPVGRSAALRSSAARANTIVIHKPCLAAGESVTVAKVQIPSDGATRIWGNWTAKGPGGFDTVHGEIPVITL